VGGVVIVGAGYETIFVAATVLTVASVGVHFAAFRGR
jgi:hypothetical protein